MTKEDKIFIQVGDDVIELLGEEKEIFMQRLADEQAKEAADIAAKEAQAEQKAALLERLGITAEEAELLLG